MLFFTLLLALAASGAAVISGVAAFIAIGFVFYPNKSTTRLYWAAIVFVLVCSAALMSHDVVENPVRLQMPLVRMAIGRDSDAPWNIVTPFFLLLLFTAPLWRARIKNAGK